MPVQKAITGRKRWPRALSLGVWEQSDQLPACKGSFGGTKTFGTE